MNLEVCIKLSILVPCYNEQATVIRLLRSVIEQANMMVANLGIDYEIIVVDDGSTDLSGKLIFQVFSEHPKLKVIKSPQNEGKGLAIRRGLQIVTGDITIIQDADLEYDPQDMERLIGPLLSGQCHAVFGTRFRGGQSRLLYFWHSLGNRLVTFLFNACSNLNLSDMGVGSKAFLTSILKTMDLESTGFEVEVELAAKVAKLRPARVYEVPVTFNARTFAEGKKAKFRDALKDIIYLFYFSFFKSFAKSYKAMPILDLPESPYEQELEQLL